MDLLRSSARFRHDLSELEIGRHNRPSLIFEVVHLVEVAWTTVEHRDYWVLYIHDFRATEASFLVTMVLNDFGICSHAQR